MIVEEELEAPEPEATEPEATEPELQELPELKNVVLFHCLPAYIRQEKDDLYDEVMNQVKYGEKFIFPAVILENIDLSMKFWTTDPHSKIAKRSVVFPFKYKDGPHLKEFRWWQVVGKEEKELGYIFEAIPSTFQPEFSD
jgi:hypothetical protein